MSFLGWFAVVVPSPIGKLASVAKIKPLPGCFGRKRKRGSKGLSCSLLCSMLQGSCVIVDLIGKSINLENIQKMYIVHTVKFP